MDKKIIGLSVVGILLFANLGYTKIIYKQYLDFSRTYASQQQVVQKKEEKEKKDKLSKDVNASLYCVSLYDEKGVFTKNCSIYPNLNEIIENQEEKKIFNNIKGKEKIILYNKLALKPIVTGKWYDAYLDKQDKIIYIGVDENVNGKLEKGEILRFYHFGVVEKKDRRYYFLFNKNQKNKKISLTIGEPKNLMLFYSPTLKKYNIIDCKFVNNILRKAKINYELKCIIMK